ncbi:RNA-directed DNA polymerase, eukaryota [Tanacetum coccineum]
MSHHMKEFEHLKIKLEALESATNNFSKESTIGIGGFGRVYKGKLAHSLGSKIVALKSLDRRNGQGDVEFWNEITILSSYQHENIVSLLGYCDESGERILVYEYETRGSLERYLNNDMLTWVQRLKISIGVARGLVCLHSEDGPLQRVLHCDIKSSNILLDENLNSKISDFGLANIGHANSQMAVAIRCWHTWVLCGRVTMVGNNKQMDLVELVKQYNEQNRIEEIIFGNIKDQINATSFGLFTTIASQCLKEDPQEGPLAIHVVRALEAALHCQMNNIKFSEQPVGILNVKIIKAIDLKRVLRVFAPNSYVNLRLTEDEENVASKNTKVVDQGVNPEWNEEFNTRAKDESTDEQWINVVPLKRFRPEERETCRLDLFKNMYSQNSKSYGQIMVEVTYKPFGGLVRKVNEGGGCLVVTILEGQHLDKKNPTIYLKLNGDSSRDFIRQTTRANTSKNPVWNEKFEFTFDKAPTDRILTLYVYGSSTWLQSFTGWNDFSVSDNYIEISLAEIVNKKHTNKIYQLASSKFGDAGLRVEMEWRYLARIPQVYALELCKSIDVASKMAQSNLGHSFRRDPKGGEEQAQFDLMLEKVEGDRWVWSLEDSGEFYIASVRRLIDDYMLLEATSKMRWMKAVPIQVNVLAWKVKLECLPTRLNISRRGMDIQSILCHMCGDAAESNRHIFFTCHIAREILRKISHWWDASYTEVSSYKEWLDWILNLRLSVKYKQIFEGVCYVMWWHIWSFRNKSIFGSEYPSKAVIFEDVVSRSLYWCRYRCKVSFS